MPKLIRAILTVCLIIESVAATAAPVGSDKDASDSCVARDPALPEYPYSAKLVWKAFDRSLKDASSDGVVEVLVIDNGFIGYAHDAQVQYVASENYPPKFFHSLSNTAFRPFEDPGPLPPDDLAVDQLQNWGHGTHVAGLILGGAYAWDSEIGAANQLDIRKLFGIGNNSWIRIFFAKVANEKAEIDGTEFEKVVDNLIEEPDDYLTTTTPSIVNASLTWQNGGEKLITNPWPRLSNSSLIVAAAGNSPKGIQLFPASRIIPAQIGEDTVLTVASHDANHELSFFSNYAANYVDIAAPGCELSSWLTGKGPPKPMTGTSMATALVSFAAGLIKRLSGNSLTPKMIAERIIAAGNFSEAALNCGNEWRTNTAVPIVAGPIRPSAGCVRFGSELDIPTALFVRHDYIEWCAGDTMPGPSCALKRAIGTLSSVPDSIKSCINASAVIELDQRHESGLSRGAAIRRAKGLFQVVYRTHKSKELSADFCKPGEQDLFEFTFDRKQIESGVVALEPRYPIKASALVRIVTSSIKVL